MFSKPLRINLVIIGYPIHMALCHKKVSILILYVQYIRKLELVLYN